MKKILISNYHQEQIQLATVVDEKLYDIEIESLTNPQIRSNIYLGIVSRVEQSLEAAFVDYGGNRHGFLPLKEILPEYFITAIDENSKESKQIVQGTRVIVQATKSERGTKGAVLSCFISLPGRHLVYMPYDKVVAVSRRAEEDEKEDVKHKLSLLKRPESAGVIIRTSGIDSPIEILQQDMNHLVEQWDKVRSEALKYTEPTLLHQGQSMVTRLVRDFLKEDVDEVIFDSKVIYEEAYLAVSQVYPEKKNALKLYEQSIPLYVKYGIEPQIQALYEREVRLKSGGAIIIDTTEALTSIDINSSRATKGGHIEETAYHTNMEAAEEVARQLRLRDIGGLVVIDFIDMVSKKNQREVEDKLSSCLAFDRSRIQVGKISRFGLLEMSRQRMNNSLEEVAGVLCQNCHGRGRVHSERTLATSIFNLIVSEIANKFSSSVKVDVSLNIANFMNNKMRKKLLKLESDFSKKILISCDSSLADPFFRVFGMRNENWELIFDTTTGSFLKHEINPLAYTQTTPAIENTYPSYKNANIFVRIFRSIICLFAPKPKSLRSNKNQPRSHSGAQRYRRRPTNNGVQRKVDNPTADNAESGNSGNYTRRRKYQPPRGKKQAS